MAKLWTPRTFCTSLFLVRFDIPDREIKKRYDIRVSQR